jgi:hypothetical protein
VPNVVKLTCKNLDLNPRKSTPVKQIVLPAIFLITMTSLAGSDLGDLVAHGHTDNNGMEIHYASLGKGPLIVMIHGFLDY